MKMKRLLFLSLIIIAYLFSSCSGINKKKGSARHINENAEVTCAERFNLQSTDSCTILTIFDPWQGANGISQVYYLAEREKALALKGDPSHIITVPVKKIICMSSTHLAMICALGEQKTIAGISGINFIYDQNLRDRADSGLIGEIGYDAGINTELILKIAPDLIMMYGIGSESAGYSGKISELGIKVMYNADYLENDPLGKAEWIKLFGALYCKEEMADSIYKAVEASYNETKSFIISKITKRPGVLLGLPFRDTWFISPGNSYISRLISDAGGNYLWQNTESSFSMPYSFETVYLQSLKADFWLNAGTINSKNEIASFDARLEKLPCYISGNIYNNTNRIIPGGGNDYWESGTLRPHIILKDIASILHPGIFGDYNLVYYRKIE
jgi:iron complex transport system substrate-binding protein